MKRKDGYYRVQLLNGEWSVGEWDGAFGRWYVCSCHGTFDDSELMQIEAEPITMPQNPTKSVLKINP